MEAHIKALITGITGQDGSFLSEFLLSKDYKVHGLKRRSSLPNTERIDGLEVKLHDGDITDTPSIMRVLSEVEPDEIYHLAAQSHVGLSFEQPEYTSQVDAIGTLRILEAIRVLKLRTRFYNASTSELFGNQPPLQNEKTPFAPRSPYGVAKQFAYSMTVNYREAYGLHAVNGILFNHESPRRGITFVTRKICRGLARIKWGLQDKILLGNIKTRRDWGHAKDFVRAMWMMLQTDPEDYVIATGVSHSVEELLDEASIHADIDWRRHVVIDKAYFRPADVNHLCGDSSKARTQLAWEPEISFEQLVKEMVEHELETIYSGHTRSQVFSQEELRRA